MTNNIPCKLCCKTQAEHTLDDDYKDAYKRGILGSNEMVYWCNRFWELKEYTPMTNLEYMDWVFKGRKIHMRDIKDIQSDLEDKQSDLESNESEQQELRSIERSLRMDIQRLEMELEEAEEAEESLTREE